MSSIQTRLPEFGITVIEATQLYNTKGCCGVMSPHLEIHLGQNKWKTSVCKNGGMHPTYSERKMVDYRNETYIDFKFYDKENYMCEGRQDLLDIKPGNQILNLTIPLIRYPHKKKSKPAGQLMVSIEFFGFAGNANNAVNANNNATVATNNAVMPANPTPSAPPVITGVSVEEGQWQWMGEGKWKDFESVTNTELENGYKAHRNGASERLQCRMNKHEYVMDFKQWTQTNQSNRKERKIRRNAKHY